jgi:hypothetical protein
MLAGDDVDGHHAMPARGMPQGSGARALQRRADKRRLEPASTEVIRGLDRPRTGKGLQMASKFEDRLPSHIQGQMLRLGEHHAVAIYLRDGVMWVADFIDGQGALVDANTWFRFNCGTLANSHALRRMALESATPISLELSERIEALHGAAVTGRDQDLVGLAKAYITSLRRGRLGALVAGRFRRRSPREEFSAR